MVRTPLSLLLLLLLVYNSPVHRATAWTVSVSRRDIPQNEHATIADHQTLLNNNVQEKKNDINVASLHFRSDVQHRYAVTVVHTDIVNVADEANEVQFILVLPERAFISSFLVEVDDEVHRADVKEKSEAEKEYNNAIQSGHTAAHVYTSAHDSNIFTVSVNVEAKSNVKFNLTYEELLLRHHSLYRHVITLVPGQVVDDLQVDVYIREMSNLTDVTVTALGYEKGSTKPGFKQENQDQHNSTLQIKHTSNNSIHVQFAPSTEEQLAFLGRLNIEDKQRQIIVQYDVNRTEHPAGEIMFSDGYFVHFFAPKDFYPLPKHVIFVLDTSGSMWGRKMMQLQDAMLCILNNLRQTDYFSFVQFNTDVMEWSTQQQDLVGLTEYRTTHDASRINIEKAKFFIKSMNVSGGTNINGALRKSLQLAAKRQYDTTKSENIPQPIIVFLTDGIPTVGELRNSRILAYTRAFNTETKAPIFSLAFGEGANFYFLKKLSLQNYGFARRIYESSDVSQQLQSFFQEIASPVLSNISFNYIGGKVRNSSLTETFFHSLYEGGELVVAGKVEDDAKETMELESDIEAWRGQENQHLRSKTRTSNKKHQSRRERILERMWAYLSIKQLLDKQLAEDSDNSSSSSITAENFENPSNKNQALKLALKYGFVTPVTSLIMEKLVNMNCSLQTIDEHLKADSETGGGTPFQNRIISLPPIQALKPVTLAESVPAKPEVTPQEDITQPVSVSKAKLTLKDLTWLSDHLDVSGRLRVSVANGSREEETFRVEYVETQEEDRSETCIAPNGVSSHCKPLPQCVLQQFADDYNIFLKYFCPLEDLAGVCCFQSSVHEEGISVLDK